ncbi:hypothetical protein H7X87_02495 [Acetobacteraceae bacterium]|nr:hypothetical protein [Candidatus Parcubacteria bacterium]
MTRAIARLRKPEAKGIHAVFSGFNVAFKKYFEKDPVQAMKKLEEEGFVICRPAKGGAVIYLYEDAPQELKDRHNKPVPEPKKPKPTALDLILQ